MSASNLSIKVGGWQFGSPAVGRDGTIYCTPAGGFNQVLKAYSPYGDDLWHYEFDSYISRPVISTDGTVYIATTQSRADEPTVALFAFTEAGGILWSHSWPLKRSGSSPLCDTLGCVYLVVNHELHKISPSGNVVWTIPVPGHEPTILGEWEDRIYLLAQNGWQSSICAVTLEGRDLWDLKAPFDYAEFQREVRQRLVEKHGQVKADQTIVRINYAPPNFENHAAFTPLGNLISANMDDYLYSISPEGSINWRFQPEKAVCIASAGKTAAVYVTWKWGVYAVTENGELLWKQQHHYTTIPVIGREGQVYVAGMHEASAFDADGNSLWIEPIRGIPGLNPAVTLEGQFCVTTDQGYLHLLG
ncbi:MAG: PQQ-binding-like beta-propeller repeat protein [Janthinobacterium lividum]